MKMILHHLRKDIRALRLPILVWLVVILAVALPDVLLIQPDYDTARWVDQSRFYPLAVFVAFIAWTILLARLVQSEPVTGSTSFWLTRPIPRIVQLPSKFIFMALFVFLPTFLPIAVHAIVFPPDWQLIRQQAGMLAIVELMVAITVIWVATYASSLLHFAGMLCLGFVSIVVVCLINAEYRMRFGGSQDFTLLLPDIVVPGFLLSLVVQHARRGGQWGLRIGLASLAIALIAQCFAQGGPRILERVDSEKTTKMEFDPAWADHVTWTSTDYGKGQPNPTAEAPLNPVHGDPDTIPWVQAVSAHFKMPGKQPISLENDAFSYGFATQPPREIQALVKAKLPGIAVAGEPGFIQPVRNASLFTLSPARAEELRGQVGELNVSVEGEVLGLDKTVALPLNLPHGIGFIPGGFARVKPVHPGDRQLVVWTIAPERSMAGYGSDLTFILVDPQARTGTVLSAVGGSTFTISSGGFSSNEGSLEDGENYFKLDGTEPLDRMVLYVFQAKSRAAFSTTLTAPNFTMLPPQ